MNLKEITIKDLIKEPCYYIFNYKKELIQFLDKQPDKSILDKTVYDDYNQSELNQMAWFYNFDTKSFDSFSTFEDVITNLEKKVIVPISEF